MSHHSVKRLLAVLTTLLAVCALAISAAVASIAATTAIFVNGTQVSYAGTPAYDHSQDSLQGYFPAHSDTMTTLNYLRTAGILTNLNDPLYDVSEKGGATNLVEAIKTFRQNNTTDQLLVGGESQGADVIVDTLEILEKQGFDTTGMTFWVIGNVANPDGGLLTRLPLDGLYIPLIGVTYGHAMEVQYSNVIQVVKQYDGAADLPKYLLAPGGLFAIVNAALGAFTYGTHLYNDVDPFDPNNQVTTNKSGTVTNILVPYKGTLPILRPLLDLGFPPDFVRAFNPFMQAVIETAYDRPDPSVPGSYPDEPVRMRLFPGPDQWLHDTVAIIKGLAETMRLLGAYAHQTIVEHLTPSAPTPVTIQNLEPEQEQMSAMQTSLSAPEPQEPETGRQASDPSPAPPVEEPRSEPSTEQAVTESKDTKQDPSDDAEKPIQESESTDEPKQQPEDDPSGEQKPSEDEGKPSDEQKSSEDEEKSADKPDDTRKEDSEKPSNTESKNDKEGDKKDPPADKKTDDKKDSSDNTSKQSTNDTKSE